MLELTTNKNIQVKKIWNYTQKRYNATTTKIKHIRNPQVKSSLS